MKALYETHSKEFKKVFDFESAKRPPELSMNFQQDIDMLTHKFKQLNFGFERDFEKNDTAFMGTMIEHKKLVPEGNIKWIPQTRKFKIAWWVSWTIAEYDVDNHYWISNTVKVDLPFFSFSSSVYSPNKMIYITGGLNDLISDKPTFSAWTTRIKEIPLNFIESKFDVREMEVMRLKRGCHASVYLNEKIYVFGG